MGIGARSCAGNRRAGSSSSINAYTLYALMSFLVPAATCAWPRHRRRYCLTVSHVNTFDASIHHLARLDELTDHVEGRNILNLIKRALKRTSERSGKLFDSDRGIRTGHPLEPLARRTVSKRPRRTDGGEIRLLRPPRGRHFGAGADAPEAAPRGRGRAMEAATPVEFL